LAHPIQKTSTRVAGIEINDTRMVRLMEVMFYAGLKVHGCNARHIHQMLFEHFRISLDTYAFNQPRYDLRKMKAHGHVERNGRRYTYALTEKGIRIALLFVLFPQRLFRTLTQSQFIKRPDSELHPGGYLERAYRRADKSIDQVVELRYAA
jgi:hypothetical protein